MVGERDACRQPLPLILVQPNIRARFDEPCTSPSFLLLERAYNQRFGAYLEAGQHRRAALNSVLTTMTFPSWLTACGIAVQKS